MTATWKHIGDLVFEGGRYDEHALEVSALAEVIRFQEIVTSVCERIWRRARPERERLPKGFRRLTTLRMTLPRSGSFEIPLESRLSRQADLIPEGRLMPYAMDLVCEAIDCLNRGDRLPDAWPAASLPALADWGQTLEEDEGIAVAVAGKSRSVFRVTTRDRARQLRPDRYYDRIDVSGTVVLADVEGCRFSLKIGDQPSIPGEFPPEIEEKVLEALRRHAKAQVRIQGRGEFDVASRKLRRILEVAALDFEGIPRKAARPRGEKPLWELAEELAASVPAEDWKAVPTDASVRVEEYLTKRARRRP